MRENIESDRKQQADDLGLTQTELAFYNILLAEVGGSETPSQEFQMQIKDVVQSLVSMLDEATQIVGFFEKWMSKGVLNEILSVSLLRTSMNL